MLSVEEVREPSDDVLLRHSVCGTSSRASTGYDCAEHVYRGPLRGWHEATASALLSADGAVPMRRATQLADFRVLLHVHGRPVVDPFNLLIRVTVGVSDRSNFTRPDLATASHVSGSLRF